MANLDLKKTAIEPLAPDKDPVSDKVNPLGGLTTVAQGLDALQKTYQDRLSESIKSQAMSEFLEKSATNTADYHKHIRTLNTSDDATLWKEINSYALKKHAEMGNFIDSVNDRGARDQLRYLNNHDLSNMKHAGLQYSLGVMDQNAITRIQKAVVSISASLASNPSDENRLTFLARGDAIIDSSRLSPAEKEEKKRGLHRTLNEVQARAMLSYSPDLFEGTLDVVSDRSTYVEGSLDPVEVVEGAGERRVELKDGDISNISGVAGWNELDQATRRTLLREQMQQTNRELAKGRRQLNNDIKRITKHAYDGVVTEDFDTVSSLSNLLKGYNPADAEALHRSLQFTKEIASYVPIAQAGTEDEFEKMLVDLHTSDTTGDPKINALIAQASLKLSHQHKEARELRAKDPHSWGLKVRKIEPLNLETGKLGDSLVSYSLFAQETEKKHGVIVNGIGASGEKQLSDRLWGTKASDFVQFFKSETDGLCREDKERAKHVLSHLKDGSLAGVALLSLGEEQEREVARTIAVGKKRYEDVKSQYKSQLGSDFDAHFYRLINKEIGKLYSSEDESYKRDAEIIKHHSSGSMKKSGSVKLSSDIVKDSVKAVLGNTVYNYNGSYILPPRNMSHTEFGDKLYRGTSDQLVRLFGDRSQARYPELYGYQTIGDGKYSLTMGGVVKKDHQGNPIIIDIFDTMPPPKFNSPSILDSIQDGLSYYK
ncbi:hypothetical protein [Candidatus Liberibacter asiaticus]|uniref:hypothetical protein n=1 Tax=Liberibacter asiaticus TaxID=34021 RepID=UPI004059CC05